MAEDPTGTWGTISFELPDVLKDVREAINSIAEVLITFLDIAIAALQLIKAFALSYLDPLMALLQAIIDFINGLLRDFAQLGIYITHDLALLTWPFDDVKGGFQEYERRMIARLTDRTDPTRPDISAQTSVFAGFFYMSVDISSILRLISFVEQLLAMFSMKFFPEGSLPVPVIDRLDYGNSAVGVFGGLSSLGTFSDTPPDKAKVTWRTPEPSRKGPANPLSAFAGPSGYFVTVSTLPEGIPCWFDRPEKDSGSKKTKRGEGDSQQNRESGLCRDATGKPIVLFGGVDEIEFEQSTLGWNNAVEPGGKLKDGVSRCYGSLDKTDGQTGIIPLGDLKDGETYYFQRRFGVELGSVAWQWATGEFSLVLDLKDMPHHAEVVMDADGKATLKDLGQPSTYYVRVSSTSSAVASGKEPYVWDFAAAANTSGQNAGEPFRVDLKKGTTSAMSGFSTPAKMVFPNANTMKFLDAIQTALAVCVLSRSDLPVIDEQLESKGEQFVADAKAHKLLLKDVALVRTGMEPYGGKLISMMFSDFAQIVRGKGDSQADFRTGLTKQVEILANKLRDSAGFTPEFEEMVVNSTENLRTATWAQMLSAVDEGGIKDKLGVYGEDTILEHLRGFKRDPKQQERDQFSAEVKRYQDELDRVHAEIAYFGEPPEDFRKSRFYLMTSADLEAAKAGLAKLKEKSPPVGAGESFGVAQNPYCIGVPAKDVDALMGIPGVVRFRKPHFIEYSPAVEAPPFVGAVPKDSVADKLKSAPPSVRAIYEQYITPDGDIKVPPQTAALMAAQQADKPAVGSADMSPVFHVGLDKMRAAAKNPDATKAKLATVSNHLDGSGILYLRSVFGSYQGGVILQEAALTLQMAGAALLRAPEDGEWIAIRFFDSFPGLEGFFEGVQNWLDQLAEAIKSMADTLIAYIEFIEARLTELQQLIRRLNALIQSILSFSLTLPKFSGLLLITQGTSGVVRGLVTATDKPADSPLAYGAGAALVAGLLPDGGLVSLFLQSLIAQSTGTSGIAGDGTDEEATTDATGGDDAFGVEGQPDPGAGPGPNDEPDVP